ncbi:Inosine-uridine nucleoside N-ribohydrolase [Cognatiyoonia sediminum]|uniref:Inosine-uridine nucleoside N-ribohydrolase n=1 Tax=Cognatiyoonia sediminum TaxID=1508389 RepID=A0A1M5RY19_9RHOB|nr:nucleoside hydrolase [Cognatiyoonia sediminum]SHH30683.1 Inosine-uridine nucleoside N-ribohydrolase [Cognatiyoonia sediminum]
MKLIIDTDPGVDDALAIALAHAMPELELIALTAIFGNTFVEQSNRNARYLLDLLGAEGVLVAEGAKLPYGADTYEPSAWVHGKEGYGDIEDIPQVGANTPETAAELLVKLTADNPGEVTVCAIGPLTNIADALRLDPTFGQNLRELVIMGGAYECPGNITPHAEANIYHDAVAAEEVFASGMPIRMVGLDATMKTLLTSDDFAEMAESSPKAGGFVDHISQFYLQFYRSVGVTNGCPMHDSTAILACAYPDKFEWKDHGVAVVQTGEEIGDTVAADRPNTKVALDVDADWAVTFVKDAIATLD